MRRWLPSLCVPALCGLLGAAGCNGNVVVDTSGGAGQAGSAGYGSYGDYGGDGGYGGNGGSSAQGGLGGDAGGGGAPPNCGLYCAEIAANCTGDLAQYGDKSTCEGLCAHFSPGNAGDTSGDTLGCRE